MVNLRPELEIVGCPAGKVIAILGFRPCFRSPWRPGECLFRTLPNAVTDPGFPVGERRPVGGADLQHVLLFGKNICKNEGIGSCWEGGAGGAP